MAFRQSPPCKMRVWGGGMENVINDVADASSGEDDNYAYKMVTTTPERYLFEGFKRYVHGIEQISRDV